MVASALFAQSAERPLSPQERNRLGERMYREGLLPSGEPMQAVVKGDLQVPGTVFTCISCHLRSGIGSVEGGVYTPPTSGRHLYKPLPVMNKGKHASTPALRPVYTDKSLAAMLWGGVDPAGRVLDYIMPRYHLHDEDMSILIDYLKQMSAEFSPGVSETALKFATVITDDVRPEDAEAMASALEKYLQHKNNMASSYEKEPRRTRMAEAMLVSREAAYKRLSLSRWLLKGPPATWREQLEAYYRKEPVFALLGGISRSDWLPIHQFSEENKIPCLLPITDYPVISDRDWYTLYFSKGLYQEGEAIARHLNSNVEVVAGSPVVQIVRATRQGRTLASGFGQAWADQGHQLPASVTLQVGEQLTEERLRVLLQERPAAILLWGGPEDLAILTSLVASANRPPMVYVASGYWGDQIWSLPEAVRGFTFIAYPFRLPQNETVYGAYTDQMLKSLKIKELSGQKLVKQMYSLNSVLSQALMELKGDYFRDSLLDVIGMGMSNGGMGLVQEETYPLYERLSFGPGQRYASKGCYIVQLTKGEKPELIRLSDWVIH